jgi:hypothetical protein
MKITGLIFLLFSFAFGQAQITMGVKGGLNIADIVINNVNDPDGESDFTAKAGFHGGIFAIAEVGSKTGLSAELLYSNKGVRALTNINLHYVAVPVMIRYSLSDRFVAEAGPELAYMITARSRYGNMNTTYDNKIDLGLDLGLHYAILPKLSVGLRLNAGMTSVIRNASYLGSSEKIRYQNRVLQLTLAWTLHERNFSKPEAD